MISEGWQEALMAASKTLLPVPTATGGPIQPTDSPVSPIPSVIPEPIHYETVTSTGARTLWVVFALMLISSASFTALSWSIPLSKRVFHVLTTVITIIATLSYFAMATGHGISYRHIKDSTDNKHVPDVHYDVYRQVFWARFVDWVLTTPLLLIDLGLLAGMSGGHITMAVLADITMVLTGLFASFGGTTESQKWAWYAISCFSYLVIIWHLFVNGRMISRASDDKVGKVYTSIATFTLVVWTAYPIVWAISDGSRKLSVDSEIIAYAVLDVLAKGAFGFWLLLTHKRVPETNVEIGGFWAYGTGDEGSLRLVDDGA